MKKKIFVCILKARIILNGEAIVQISFCEIQIEIRLIKVEHTVVVGPVDLIDRIVHAKSAVAECRVELVLAGAACDD